MIGSTANHGGNHVTTLDPEREAVCEFARCSYVYYQATLTRNEPHKIEELGSFTVFVQHTHQSGSVVVAENGQTLQPGDSIEVENNTVTLSTAEGAPRILVSGVAKGTSNRPAFIKITRNGEHYKVGKPWGHELWINGEHPDYCLKEVFILAGNRTSLQYHNFKEETNILISGKANLFFHIGDEPRLESVELRPISSIHVTPKVVHRLESVEDSLLYETSTPYLDDVVRLQDDTNRSNGRIQSEHRGNS